MPVRKKCERCGKEFIVKPYRKDSARFCSRKCWTTSEEARQIVSAAVSKRQQQSPMVGDKNPNWRGGITKEQRSRLTRASWKKRRKEALEKYGNKCRYCGSTQNLHVHHKKPWRETKDDSLEGLEIVCSKCHPFIERLDEIAQAIRKKCWDCVGHQKIDCCIPDCPLYYWMPYRNIKSPKENEED